MTNSEEMVTLGVYGSQVYGPYSEWDIEDRESSSTNYADSLFDVPARLENDARAYYEGSSDYSDEILEWL